MNQNVCLEEEKKSCEQQTLVSELNLCTLLVAFAPDGCAGDTHACDGVMKSSKSFNLKPTENLSSLIEMGVQKSRKKKSVLQLFVQGKK